MALDALSIGLGAVGILALDYLLLPWLRQVKDATYTNPPEQSGSD